MPTSAAQRFAYIALLGAGNRAIQRTLEEKSEIAQQLFPEALDVLYSAAANSKSNLPAGYLRSLTQRYRQFAQFDLPSYDRLLVRYPGGDPSGLRWAQEQPVVFEMHTDPLAEHLADLRSARSPALRVSKVLRYALERLYGPPILRRGRGLVTLTDELAGRQLGRVGQDRALPTVTITNGITVDSLAQTGFRPFRGNVLRLAMTASSDTPWHGLDRLVRALNCYDGSTRFELHIFGPILQTSLPPATSPRLEITHHGYLQGPELDEALSNMHLGVSTLALYRKNMRQACSLKTREYMARGLPFLLAYDDPDLTADADADFCLRLENRETPLDVEEILAFAQRTASHGEELSETMRARARERMDWSVKLRHYVGFLNGLH